MKRILLTTLALLASLGLVRADATLVFNEIMYHPATNEPAMEWVELYNQLAVDLDVSGWSIDGDIGFKFPPNTRITGRSFVVVALDPAALMAAKGITNVLGPFTNRLSNGGGTLRLLNNNGRVLDDVNYGTEDQWPVAPDGAGPSLAKLDEDFGSADPANWRASIQVGGNPGTINVPRGATTTTTRTLVPLTQVWKYDQSAADLGTAWKETNYNDSVWLSGPGVLALEDNAAVTALTNTILSLTNVSGQRVLTYYFRTHFTYSNNPANVTLSAANLIDDGAVVYLNGAEIYRYRVVTGQNYQTLADNQTSEGTFETITFTATNLHQGDNVLAAEVHQVNNASSDVAFGLKLDEVTTLTNYPGMTNGANLSLAFNEMSTVTNAQFWIELVNAGSQPVLLDNCVLGRFGTTYREYLIPAHTVAPGEYFVLDRATLGFGADPGDRVVLYAPGKTAVLDAVVAKSYPRARLPEALGEWLRPSETTPGASNRFALHTELVINEIMYNHKPFPSVNGLPTHANPEEWIELYNRSSNAVDLTGWQLKGGISYSFPSGKILAPNSYLVIAKDATTLKASYPGVDIIGDFKGGLSAEGELLRLEDPNGNPANQVQYYTWGRWADYANGGGSSLELRDPNADNSKAEAWAASDESSKASWQTYSYRMVAQASVASGSDSPWREFLLGLLAGGECMVDDIRVVQSPTNNPVSLLVNGDLETGITGWRVLGTHSASEVIAEPGNPGNHVLHVVATGPQEHMNNHIETTLANGLSVVNGQLYEITYRAKWLAGNSMLNTRLWFDRVARTTELLAPQNNGTPGARNSRYEPKIGPTFAQFQHQPVVPEAGAPVTVSVQAEDPEGVTNCQVFWAANGSAFSSAPLALQPGGLYTGTIPGYPASTIVQFYVRAADGLGAAATYPARSTNGGALYRVNDGQANVALEHNIRIVTTPANAALLHADTNVMSNDNLPCTVIYDERIAYYDAGVRLKASMNGRPYSSRVGFHLSFQPDQLFRGVHPAMGLDRRSGDTSPANEEILVRHIALVAGGIPTMYLDVVKTLSPRGTENGPALFTPSYEDELTETAFENGGQGQLFEMEGPYVSTTANAYGYKLPQPNNSGNYIDVADHGNDKEAYRYHYIQKNHHDEDDYGPLIALSKAFSLNGTALETQTSLLMDMNEWLRAYAVLTLCGVNDTYTFWLQHNMMFYFRPSDHKALYFMWDNDFTFARASTDRIVGDQNLGRIINLPSNLRVLYAHLLDIMSTTYNTDYLTYWLNHYAPFSSTSYARTTYIQERTAYIKGIIGAATNAPFTVTVTNLSVSGSNVVVLSGTAPVGITTITLNGLTWPVTWSTLTNWSLRVPLGTGTNALQIAGCDLQGRPVINAVATATAVVTGIADSPVDRVVFNEIMFEPAVPGGEYIELYNRSTNTTFDLSGWRINGLDYIFLSGSQLSPRSYLVLAKNRAVFLTTYGNTLPLFDEFPGQLQRDGETLTLLMPGANAGEESIVDQVRYEGNMPWPAAAALGTGSSYQLIDPNQDNRRAGNWFATYSAPVYEGGISTPAQTNTGWRLVSLTGSIGLGVGGGQQRLLIYLGETNGTSAIIDDISLVAGTNAATGYSYIRNGDFESPLLDDPVLTNSWVIASNYSNSSIVGTPAHSGQGALRLECTTFGNIAGKVIAQNLSPAPPANSTNTLSFWFWSTNSATNLFVRIQNSSALTTGSAGTNINPTFTPSNYVPPTLVSPGTNSLSPGTANQGTASLPAFPTLWINEVLAENTNGITDSFGEREPWLELYNDGANTVSLDNLYLSGNYTNLTNWAFPAGYSIGAKQFRIIFCDGQTTQTTSNELHTNFRLPANSGSVALSRLFNAKPQVVDYLNYAGLPPNRSYGSYSDGVPFDRQQFYYVTPVGTNDARSAPLLVFINEWMALNTRILTDPADGDYDDWFELYNPTTNAVDLAGYYLTDTLTNRTKYLITTNGPHIVPPQSYLLAWADNETGQNTSATGPRTGLHVSFQLAGGGEAIGLFAADGTQIDAITFGQQTNDISMGRYPDGSSNIVFMAGSASPRAANYLTAGNHPPIVDPIGTSIAYVGQALTLTVSAHDNDTPPQTLYYTFVARPPGANISTAGVFSWTPRTVGSYSVAVRVGDDGVPPMSTTNYFTVDVYTPLQFTGGTLNDQNLTLQWHTVPGLCYALDYKQDLNTPAWAPLMTNRAAGVTLSFTNSTTKSLHQFYRIRTVPNCAD